MRDGNYTEIFLNFLFFSFYFRIFSVSRFPILSSSFTAHTFFSRSTFFNVVVVISGAGGAYAVA